MPRSATMSREAQPSCDTVSLNGATLAGFIQCGYPVLNHGTSTSPNSQMGRPGHPQQPAVATVADAGESATIPVDGPATASLHRTPCSKQDSVEIHLERLTIPNFCQRVGTMFAPCSSGTVLPESPIMAKPLLPDELWEI